MNKQPKAWVESLLVAYVDNQLEPDQMAAVEKTILEDPEAQAIVGVLRRSAAAVKAAYDRPLQEPVPEQLLTAIGVAAPSAANVVPLRRPPRLLPSRQTVMALAASIVALAVGFGAGYMQFKPAGGITIAGSSRPSERFEAALYRALEQNPSGTQLSFVDDATGATETITIVGPVTTAISDACREFRHDAAGATGATVSRGLACRSSSGDWFTLTLPAAPAT